ncbi:MAG: glycosyltransferase family 4 protein [Deltaproteobacteria bacterium]|nr:glycosyltransferase family 4 protein [Deltaproteobacteria bacterium]
MSAARPSVMACSHSRDDPASRFRVVQYLPLLAEAGWRVAHRPLVPSRYWQPATRLPGWRGLQRRAAAWTRTWHRRRDVRDAAGFDVVLLNRDLHRGRQVWEQRLFAANPRVVFDFDDAIYLGDKRAHIEWICRRAAWVTAGNATLAEFARQYTDRVTLLPTVVDPLRYALHDAGDVMPTAPLRVGWLGSDLSIRETLYPHWKMLGRLQHALGFEFVICSRPRPQPPSDALRWSFLEWSPRAEEAIGRHLDVGVMPLVDNEFQRGKCGLKLLQYMAAGLPVIASPVGINRALVQADTGFLATGEHEWHAALRALLVSPERRIALGRAGRARCERDFSLRGWVGTLHEILSNVASGAR